MDSQERKHLNLQDLAIFKKESLCIIPIPYKEKAAAIKWQEFQSRKPTVGEVTQWFLNEHESNLAVVCGAISGNLVVLDCDSEEKFNELMGIIGEKTGCTDFFSWTTIVKTGKGFHIYLKTDQPVKSMKFPALDIKGEGGYVIAPPSIHPSGAAYRFANDIFIPAIRHVKDLKEIGIDIEQKPVQQDSTQPGWVTELLKGMGEGDRDNAGIRLAGYFSRRLPADVVEMILNDWNKKNNPPLDNYSIQKILRSAYKYTADIGDSIYYPQSAPPVLERHKSVTENVTSEQIEEWCSKTTGWFSYEELDRDLGIVTPDQKHNRRTVTYRLREAKKLESHPRDNKLMRWVNVQVRLVDFKRAGGKSPLAVRYPFHIEQYFNTFPGNIIVLAGAADAGKTAFLLNFVYLNQSDFSIYYQSSEMGETELASRLEKFEGIRLDEWNFTVEERSRDFADVIRPDCINIIDYMELSADSWNVAEYLRQIHDKLQGGIAIVALQKKRGAELGRGSDFGLEKPRLYLTMDGGVLKIQKAKNWANPEQNPNGLEVHYKIINGCKFLVTASWNTEVI